MSFERAIELLKSFDYEKNGKELTIQFLIYIIYELYEVKEV